MIHFSTYVMFNDFVKIKTNTQFYVHYQIMPFNLQLKSMKNDFHIWKSENWEIAPVCVILHPLLTQIFVVGEKLFGLLLQWEFFKTE